MHGGDVEAVRRESKHTLTDPEGEPLDFVIAIKFVYQAVAFMVSQINLIHAPRYIWFMASDPRSCTILTALAGNVRCMPESSVARHGWCAPCVCSLPPCSHASHSLCRFGRTHVRRAATCAGA